MGYFNLSVFTLLLVAETDRCKVHTSLSRSREFEPYSSWKAVSHDLSSFRP